MSVKLKPREKSRIVGWRRARKTIEIENSSRAMRACSVKVMCDGHLAATILLGADGKRSIGDLKQEVRQIFLQIRPQYSDLVFSDFLLPIRTPGGLHNFNLGDQQTVSSTIDLVVAAGQDIVELTARCRAISKDDNPRKRKRNESESDKGQEPAAQKGPSPKKQANRQSAKDTNTKSNRDDGKRTLITPPLTGSPPAKLTKSQKKIARKLAEAEQLKQQQKKKTGAIATTPGSNGDKQKARNLDEEQEEEDTYNTPTKKSSKKKKTKKDKQELPQANADNPVTLNEQQEPAAPADDVGFSPGSSDGQPRKQLSKRAKQRAKKRLAKEAAMAIAAADKGKSKGAASPQPQAQPSPQPTSSDGNANDVHDAKKRKLDHTNGDSHRTMRRGTEEASLAAARAIDDDTLRGERPMHIEDAHGTDVGTRGAAVYEGREEEGAGLVFTQAGSTLLMDPMDGGGGLKRKNAMDIPPPPESTSTENRTAVADDAIATLNIPKEATPEAEIHEDGGSGGDGGDGCGQRAPARGENAGEAIELRNGNGAGKNVDAPASSEDTIRLDRQKISDGRSDDDEDDDGVDVDGRGEKSSSRGNDDEQVGTVDATPGALKTDDAIDEAAITTRTTRTAAAAAANVAPKAGGGGSGGVSTTREGASASGSGTDSEDTSGTDSDESTESDSDGTSGSESDGDDEDERPGTNATVTRNRVKNSEDGNTLKTGLKLQPSGRFDGTEGLLQEILDGVVREGAATTSSKSAPLATEVAADVAPSQQTVDIQALKENAIAAKEAELAAKKAENATLEFQWRKSHTHYSASALGKLCRVMVRDAVNADREARGLAPFGNSGKLYEASNRPDWWPLAEFSSKDLKTRSSAVKVYEAARKVLAAAYNVKLEDAVEGRE